MWVTLHFFIIPFFFLPFFFHATKRVPVARALCIPNATTSSSPIPFASRYPLVQSMRSTIRLPPPFSLSLSSLLLLLLFSSRQFIPFMNTFITLHRDHLTRNRNSGRVCGHVLSRWINVDRDRASFHLDSIGWNALFALFVT